MLWGIALTLWIVLLYHCRAERGACEGLRSFVADQEPLYAFFLGFAGYSSKLPFDPSMMVHLHKRLSEEDIKRINELVAERFKAMGIEALSSLQDDDNSGDPGAETGNQLSIDDIVKPAD